MKRLLFLCLATLTLAGCSDDETTSQPPSYLDQSSPEAVIATLQEVWERKDIDTYEFLLRHDYRFQFQPQDAGNIGTEFWNRDQELTAVGGLFRSMEIGDIRVELVHGAPTDSDDPSLPSAKKVRSNPARLEVDKLPDIVLVVDSAIEDFYLMQGDPGFGEDPDLWYIVQWRDVPLQSKGAKNQELLVEQYTWGQVKAAYR